MAIIRNRKNEIKRTIAAALTGIFLLLCGLAISGGAYSVYTGYKASLNWPQVTTVIKDLSFVKNEDDTFSIKVTYSYTFNDKTYSDSPEYYYEYDEQKARNSFQKMQGQFEQKSGWKVFINPQNPQENLDQITFPDFIFLILLVASIFILFGLGLMYISKNLLSEIRYERKLQNEHPDEPWKWSSKWGDGIICSERRNSLPVYTFALIFWFQLTSFFIYAGYSDPLEINIGMTIAGLMIIAGLFFTFLVIKSQFKLLHHGQSFLELTTFPGFSGSELKGIINVPFLLNPESPVQFHIDCVSHHTTHDLRGKAQSRTNVHWKESFTIPRNELKNENNVTLIPFSINIPTGLPESFEDGVTWSLRASAKRETLNWSESFPLPVFHRQIIDKN